MMENAKDWIDLARLYSNYSSAVDSGNWTQWPDFFTEQCVYRLQPRENYDRGFPLATLSFESRKMLEDRVYGIQETLFHDPYYQRHIVGAPLVHKVEDGRIFSEANYVVIRTKLNKFSTVYNAGRYIDEIVSTMEGLRFASRLVIYDSEMIPNSIIYPI